MQSRPLSIIVLFILALSSTYFLRGTHEASPSNPTFSTGGIAFGPATIIDPQRTEGEPLVHIDQAGNIWETGPWGFSTAQGFIARSTDFGDSFHIVSPAGLRPNPIQPAGGGDSDIITDDQGNAYFADLEGLASVGVAVSNDQGNNWIENSFAASSPVDDRQWLAVDNGLTPAASDNTIFLTYRQIPEGSQVLSSPGSTGTGSPGGLIYANAADTLFVAHGAPCGRLTFDPVLRFLYLPCLQGNHVEIAKAHVDPLQRTGLHFVLRDTPTSPGGAVGHLFGSLTVDRAGNVYVAWVDTNNNNVYLSSSTNAGDTWSTPLQVNGNPADTNVMPWAVAGTAGTVDIVFYGTNIFGDPNLFPSWFNNRQAATTVKWFVYFVQVQGATTSNPTIFQVQASEHPTDYGQLCTQGLECTVTGGDRTLADFFSVAVDANGAARIVYDDLTNQHHGAALFELTQVAGPSAIGTTLVQSTPNVASGVTDPAGDAQVPHYSPAGQGFNRPALDLLALQLSRPDLSHLTITMKLLNLNLLLPPPGSATGIVWLTRWQFKSIGDGGEESYRIFYMGANSTAGQTPTFFAGTGKSGTPGSGIPPGSGCVTTTPQNCKIILYPNEKLETGKINKSTGTITITAPLADIGNPTTGDILFSVTALTFGYTKGNPILQDADATRSFDFVLGAISQPPGCDESDGNGDFQGQQLGNFNLDDDGCRDGDQDSVQSTNRGDGGDFQSTRIDTVTIDSTGHVITITGVGVSRSQAVSFVFVAVETGPTTLGWVSFTFSDGYTNAGTLLNGNITLH